MKFEKKMFVRMLFVLIIVDVNEINGYKIRKTKEDYHNKNHEYNLHKGKKFILYKKDISKMNFNSHLFVICCIGIIVLMITIMGLIGLIFLIKEYIVRNQSLLHNNSIIANRIYQMKLNKLLTHINNIPPPPPPCLSTYIMI